MAGGKLTLDRDDKPWFFIYVGNECIKRSYRF
jgi:hypothetical protein